MRDLLPAEASRQIELCRELRGSFQRFGYEPVSVPPFEYAAVLEHDMGPLDPGQVLRFVEPETGEVVALRPDMTPQVARLVATRLADAPAPIRLCYEGAVVRRRVERARRERQIHQAGFELVGLGGSEGDVEVLAVAASAIRATGLADFTLDLGHAGVAASLVAFAPPAARAPIVEALAAKDAEETRRRAEAAGIHGRELAALVALPALYGADGVWARAESLLGGTAAEAPARELRGLYDAALTHGLAARVVVDFGETWSFAYYTGMLFRILAEGPGESVGSGGRYDGLFDRFGAPRPAAGFAIDVGNLSWALERTGVRVPSAARVLVTSKGDVPADSLLGELRERGIACAAGPAERAADYARAWRYSHHVELSPLGGTILRIENGSSERLEPASPRDMASAVVAVLTNPPWTQPMNSETRK